MSPEKVRAEHWDTMCFTVVTVSSGGRPCLPADQGHMVRAHLRVCVCPQTHTHTRIQTGLHSLCSPLVLICTMIFNRCVLDPLRRCHELFTLSASFMESTVSTRNRFGTPECRKRERERKGVRKRQRITCRWSRTVPHPGVC